MVSKTRGKKVRALRAKPLSAKKARDIRGGFNIEGIKGESQESTHKDWIEVLSCSHAVTTKL